MILLFAVLTGLLAGFLRSWFGGRELKAPYLRLLWLVPIAFLPQLFAFQLPATQKLIPDNLAALGLVISQLLLLVFAWANRNQPGFWMLGLGLLLNLAVIALNGGLMPISPETVTRLAPNAPPEAWHVGERLGTGKDIVIPEADMHLSWLADRFLLPDWTPYRVAFSLGDVFISVGAFWLLWSFGKQIEQNEG